MQIYADVCNRPMKISRSAQTCALGAAIFGAVACDAYKTVQRAQRNMTGVKGKIYRPNKAAAKTYAELYGLYRTLHDAFGTNRAQQNLGHVMKQLIAIRNRTRRKDP
jgi:L-ribulokinase